MMTLRHMPISLKSFDNPKTAAIVEGMKGEALCAV